MAWLTVIVLLIAIVGSTAALLAISALYREADQQRGRANTQLAATQAAQAEAEQHREALRREVYSLDIQQAFEAWEENRVDEVLDILHRHLPRSGEPDLRTLPWYTLQSRTFHAPLAAMRGHTGPVREVAIHPDDRRLVSAGDDGTIRTWDTATGDLLQTIEASSHPLHALAISPDGKYVVTGYNSLEKWELDGARKTETLADFDTTIEEAVFSPDGRYLVAGSRNQPAKLMSLEDGTSRILETNTGNEGFVFSRDGKLVTAICSLENARRVRSWRVTTGDIFRDFPTSNGPANLVVEAPQRGYFLIAPNGTGRISLHHSMAAAPMASTARLRAKIMDLALSPDGYNLVAGCSDGMIGFWRLTGVMSPHLRDFGFGKCQLIAAHQGSVNSIAFIDNDRLASCGDDGEIKTWELDALQTTDRPLAPGTSGVQLAPDASHMLVWNEADQLQSIEVSTGDTMWSIPRGVRDIVMLAIAESGSRFATVDRTGAIDVWDARERRVLQSFSHPYEVLSTMFSPDGQYLATTGVDGHTSVWNVSSSKQVFTCKLASWGRALDFSADKRWMALGGHAPEILIVDTDLWRIVRRLPVLTDVLRLKFHPNNQFLTSAHFDAGIQVWDLRTGDLQRTLEGHGAGAVTCLAFHPSGRTLLSSGGDGTIRFWDLATRRHLGADRLPAGRQVQQIVFSEEGRQMLVLTQNAKQQFFLQKLSVNWPEPPLKK